VTAATGNLPRPWEEPVRGGYTDAGDFVALTGLELLTRYTDGSGRAPPPIHYLTGLTFVAAEHGAATFTLPVTDWLLAPQGVVSGSALCLLADGPLGCAVQTLLPAATPYTTAEMSMSFVRPVLRGSGTLTGTATSVHAGRSVGLADLRVTDERDRLIAVGSTRCIILPKLDGTRAQRAHADGAVPGEEPTPAPYERDAVGSALPDDVWQHMSGLDVLRGHIDSTLPAPPIANLLGIRPVAAEEGRTSWRMPASEWLCSPVRGRLYGGATAFLAGTACDGAYQSVVRRGSAFAPIDLKVYFLRPVSPDGRDLVANGSILHRGRTFAVAESEVLDADGKRVAVAVGAALLRPGGSYASASPGEGT
jgi:uncharacterized protein (TIGR00369 family)